MTVILQRSWTATDLGQWRPCQWTYESYPYESQPRLEDVGFLGGLEWIGDLGAIDQDAAAAVAALQERCAEVGLLLPPDFVEFSTRQRSRLMLDEVSVTGCWSDLASAPVPSQVEPGAYLVRFLRDQQDCLIWCLYLRPGGETLVVTADPRYAYLDDDELDETERKRILTDLAAPEWCSPTFAHFAYRYWLENMLWQTIHDGDESRMLPAMRAYLDLLAAPGLTRRHSG